MATNVVEILTRLTGTPEVKRGLDDLRQALGDTGRAGNDAAPPLAAAGGALKAIGTIAGGILTAGVLTSLARQILAFGRESDAAARTAERAMRGLEASVRATGQGFAPFRAETDRLVSSLEDLTGIADDDLVQALRRLTTLTGDYQKSLSLLTLTADLAAATDRHVVSAAEAVGRAAAGRTDQLRRLIPSIREGATAEEALATAGARVAGQAAAQAQAADRLANAWDHFKERVGGVIRTVLDPLRHLLADILGLMTRIMTPAEATPESLLRMAEGLSIDRVLTPGAGFQGDPEQTRARLREFQATLRRQVEGARRFREAPAGLAASALPDPNADVFAALSQSLQAAESRFALFRQEEDYTEASIAALETALTALLERGLKPTDVAVADIAERLRIMTDRLERLQAAAEGAGRMTGGEASARATAAAMEVGRQRAAAGQAILDAIAVEQADRELEALALANATVAEEADRAKAALERVAGAMTTSEATARANARAVQRVSQNLSDAEIAMQTWTGVTLENLIQVEDASVSLWRAFEVGAADAFAAVLVEGDRFARRLKDLFRALAADVVRIVARMGLQRAVASLFSQAGARDPGTGERLSTSALASASGPAAVAPTIAAVGVPLFFQMQQDVGVRVGMALGARRSRAELGTAIGTAVFPFGGGVVGGILAGLTSGAGGRAERRRGRQVPQRIAELEALGIDRATAEAIVAQQEATRGRFGSGGSFFELGDLITVARSVGLRGEVAGRGLSFVTNFAANRAQTTERLGQVTGGLAGFAPQAAETVAILSQGATETLKHWEQVDTFFQRFNATLQAVSETLDSGVRQGIGRAIQAYLRGEAGLFEGLRQGLRAAIEGAIIEAIVNGALLESLLGSILERLRDAITLGTEDPVAVMRDLAAQIPTWAATLEALLAPIRPALNAIAPQPVGPRPTGVFPVPAFADGGIVTGPTLAVIGEAGPEAVVPLSRGGGSLRLEVPVYLDRREIARAMRDVLPSEIRLGLGTGR